jgi:hypothetical protein
VSEFSDIDNLRPRPGTLIDPQRLATALEENNVADFRVSLLIPVIPLMTTLALVPKPPSTTKPKLTAKQANAVPTRVMGLHDPLRLFNKTHPGYLGSYQCDGSLQWLVTLCGGQEAARRATNGTATASTAPGMGNVVTMPRRTPGTTQERSPRRRKPPRRST